MEELNYVLTEDFPEKDSPNDKQFAKDNCTALYLISSTLSDSETRLYPTIKTAKELWQKLEEQ